ncbi:MAG: flagellar hook-length control protein FliK [Gammaproteobacteria bacterium]|nr:flagellar hook-length control protein FliK [Gammaproteobacteria bacterium]
MNLELLQLTPQISADSSKNSISSMSLQNSPLLEFAGNDEFFQQLQQEFNISEQNVVEQTLPESGKNLPVVKDADAGSDSSEIVQLNEEALELLRSDEFINSNVMSTTPAILLSVQSVLSPLDTKALQPPVVLNSKPVNVLTETTEVILEEIDANFSEEEMAEIPSELIQTELNRKSQVYLDTDAKSVRGDTGLTVSLATGYLSPSLRTTAAPTTTLNATLAPSVSDYEAWGDELSNRMAWMVSKDIKMVSLRLNPVDLGPVEVRIQIKNEQVDVLFNSTHSQVREAIEAAVPRLRDMFSEQLLRLDNVNISQHAFGDQKERSRGHGEELFADNEAHAGDDGPESEEETVSVLSNSAMMVDGKIDYFV